MATAAENRRIAVERIFSEAQLEGHPVDESPEFRAWVEEWIAGAIDVAELRRRYNELRGSRLEAKRIKWQSSDNVEEQPRIEEDGPLEELPRLADEFDQSYVLSATRS